MPDTQFPEWMDKTGFGEIGILTLVDGHTLTVEITGFDEDQFELLVEVISKERSDLRDSKIAQAISIDRIIDFEPESRSTHHLSDPCRSGHSSLARLVLMSTIFLLAVASGIPLFLYLADKPYGPQKATLIVYTLAVIFFTFASTGGRPRYLFTCPAVQLQISTLLWRHLGFLTTVFVLVTSALAIRADLPAWWNAPDAKNRVPFQIAVGLFCYVLGLIQVWINRSLLSRAHRLRN